MGTDATLRVRGLVKVSKIGRFRVRLPFRANKEKAQHHGLHQICPKDSGRWCYSYNSCCCRSSRLSQAPKTPTPTTTPTPTPTTEPRKRIERKRGRMFQKENTRCDSDKHLKKKNSGRSNSCRFSLTRDVLQFRMQRKCLKVPKSKKVNCYLKKKNWLWGKSLTSAVEKSFLAYSKKNVQNRKHLKLYFFHSVTWC